MSLCTVCGSDLHTVAGRRPGPTPCVLGHEAVGVIEAVGDGAVDVFGRLLRIGERVVWGVAASCRACFYCRHNLPQKCETLRKYGHDRVASGSGPHGGYATHCHLHRGSAVVRLPDGLPDVVAAPAACATATVAAAFQAVGLPPLSGGGRGNDFPPAPECAVVFGLGMLGLTACAMASAVGVSAVVGCDVDDARLSLARQFGATHTVALPGGAGLVDLVQSLTDGRGADLAFELSGSPVAAGLSLDVLRTGGSAVWVGAVLPTDTVSVSPEQVIRRCLTLTGIHNYAPPDLATAVAFLQAYQRRFPFAGLVPRTFALDEIDEAFGFAAAEKPVRVGVGPGG